MTNTSTDRGFQLVTCDAWPPRKDSSDELGYVQTRLVEAASVILDYEDSYEKPGSSALWIGENARLNREEVAELIIRLQHWIATGNLYDQCDQQHRADTGI